ncbi:MAG: maleylpyruvate isomerase N-terminal domain-containing protein [Chloroflexi bacterium]|nr:maleylpyruvate isomerase N-terminal domain-containing protein [Chloroflexota bacterium]
MNPDVEAVMHELDAHRARFEALCRSLTAEELARPVPQSTWLVRDFISHLGTIDGPVGEMFRTMHAGADPGIRDADGGKFDVDNWNERQVQERRSWDVEQLLEEAANMRAVLRGHMAALTETDIARTMKFGGDGKRPPGQVELRQYLRGWCKHDPMHALDMLRAMPERRSPEMEAWFDDPIIRGYQAAMNPGTA